ncbi:hypothetical protein JXA80_02130 [bacterium]|nr:hypothetical protein [candidate division CSSED10-310 bacterium]
MDALINELKLIPGVLGSFVYHNAKGILGSNLPSLFRNEALKQVGSLLGRIFKLSETTGVEVSNFEIRYEESLLLIKPIEKDSILVVVCEPGVSLPLVNMSTSMLIPELKAAVLSAPVASAEAPAPARTDATATVPSTVDPNKLMNEGPLAGVLKEMKIALAHAIGPIANLVIAESIETWCQSGTPSKDRLKDLVKILAGEIGDRALEAKFNNEIKHLI